MHDYKSLPAARLKSNCVMFPTKALLCSHMTAASINNHIISARGPAPGSQHKLLFGDLLIFLFPVYLLFKAQDSKSFPKTPGPFCYLTFLSAVCGRK